MGTFVIHGLVDTCCTLVAAWWT